MACATSASVIADPGRHEVYLVAFQAGGPGYLVIERKGDAPARLVAHDPRARRSLPLAAPGTALARSVAAALAPWPERPALWAALEASGAAAVLEELGWVAAELQPGPDVVLEGGRARLDDDGRPRLAHDAFDVLLAAVAEAEPTDRLWLLSPDKRRIGLELAYAGEPTVRAVHVAELAPARSRLLSVEAFALHGARAFAEARALWESAHALDPEALDVVYNLACASARLGEAERAIGHLRTALGGDRRRYSRLAESDDDLASLRDRADFRALLRPSGD